MAVVSNVYTLIPTQEFLDELTQIVADETRIVPDITLTIDGTVVEFSGMNNHGWASATGWQMQAMPSQSDQQRVGSLSLAKQSATVVSSITVSGFKKVASSVVPVWEDAKGGVTLYTNAAGSTGSEEPSPLFREATPSSSSLIDSVEELVELSKSAVTIVYESGAAVKRYYPCSFIVTGEQALFSVIDINVLTGQQTVRYFGAGTGK